MSSIAVTVARALALSSKGVGVAPARSTREAAAEAMAMVTLWLRYVAVDAGVAIYWLAGAVSHGFMKFRHAERFSPGLLVSGRRVLAA